MGRQGATRWASILAALAMAWLAWAMPAGAQEPDTAIYSKVPGFGIRLAPLDKPQEQITRETAAADAAEADCDLGRMSGCASLGRAFLHGEGRPQNRPVAEVLLRQACNGGEASGCHALGTLLLSATVAELRADGRLALTRGCRLGDLEACADEADALERGDDGTVADRPAAIALRQEACAKGGTTACRDLGSHLAQSDDPQQRDAGLSLLERTCRGGDRLSCGWLLDRVRDNAPLAQEIAAIGCEFGAPYLCREAGDMLFTAAGGTPEGRDAALALFDRACTLEKMFCSTPATIRAEPALKDSCRGGGVQADCIALGEMYARDDLPLYSPAQAAALLGAACDQGVIDACGAAARAINGSPLAKTPGDAANVARWYETGCRGGSDYDCETLGTDLLEGEATFEQRQQGYALLALACERGRLVSCTRFDQYAFDDPSAPIIPADSRFVPVADKDEEPEPDTASRPLARKEFQQDCRTSQVEFRGTVYIDTICGPNPVRVTRGRFAQAGEAPWQALLWRPPFMAGRTLSAKERVECGGALIRHGWILTAAHCVIDGNRKPIITEGYRIRLGTYYSQEPDGIEYQIKGIYAHPDYKLKLRTFDIALLQLELGRRTRIGSPGQIRSIEFDQIPVEQRSFAAGAPVRVFGWGHTSFEGTTSNGLKVAELQLEGQDVCEKTTGTALRSRFKASLLCAKAADRSQACDADSGGPLVYYEKNRMNVRRPLLVGVVSAGTECGRRGHATRYTRVAKMAEWIRDVLAGKGQLIAPR